MKERKFLIILLWRSFQSKKKDSSLLYSNLLYRHTPPQQNSVRPLTLFLIYSPTSQQSSSGASGNEWEVYAPSKLGIIYPKFLKFKDATKREYTCEEDYLYPLNDPKKDSSFSEVKKKLNEIVKNKRDALLLFPLGLGYHIDHSILFKIGKELNDKRYKVLFYEDVGYDMTKNENLITSYLKKKNLQLINKTFYFNDVKGKLKLCRIYKTQISKELISNIKKIAIERKGERVLGSKETFSSLNL